MDKLKYGLIIGTIAYFIGSVAFFFNAAKSYKISLAQSFVIYFMVGLFLDYIIYRN